jgi:hypothetical protein
MGASRPIVAVMPEGVEHPVRSALSSFGASSTDRRRDAGSYCSGKRDGLDAGARTGRARGR